MTAMPEGNITNQYPLTKIRNYYRMGDGILDSKFLSYPATAAPFIFQDQTSPNLAHIPTTNMFPYSEDFNNFSALNNAVVTVNQTTSPTGTLTADKITYDGTLYGRAQKTMSVTNGNTYTQSVYLKNNDLSDVTQVWIGFSAAAQGQFITITNEWQRYSVTVVADGSSEYPRVQFSGTGSLFAWGIQLEEQSQATAYIKSDGIAAVRKSSTTNEIVYSNDLTKSAWSLSATATYGQTGYEGNNDAWLLTKSGASNSDYYNTAFTGVYTFSFYVKKETNKGVKIYNFGDSTQSTTINIENGTHIAGVNTVGIENITNDWLRISLTLTVSNGKFYLYVTDGSGTQIESSIIVQYFQIEQQTQAETYAPTTGLPVTIDLFKENNYGTTQGGVIQKDVPRNS